MAALDNFQSEMVLKNVLSYDTISGDEGWITALIFSPQRADNAVDRSHEEAVEGQSVGFLEDHCL